MQVSSETEMGVGYSINSCALIRIDVGRVMSSDFATLALTISSSAVGSSTGMSPGLAPFTPVGEVYLPSAAISPRAHYGLGPACPFPVSSRAFLFPRCASAPAQPLTVGQAAADTLV